MLKRLRSLWRVLRSRQAFEQGMTEELRFHIEQYTDDLVASGVPLKEATRRARVEFGSVTGVRDECREARGLQPLHELARQVRHAARLLRKTPGFTSTALLTLAICLGANLTIFAVVDSILLRPLPFPEADRLVTMFNTYPKAGVDRDGSSFTNYYERRGRIPAFSSLALYRETSATLGDAGATEREPVMLVSPEFFATLGTGPVMGRGFTEAEVSLQANPVAILTDAYWRRHFDGDPHIAGRQVRVDGVRATVVGVLPASFRFLSSEASLYLPYTSRPDDRLPARRHWGGNSRQLIARLSPGATIGQAQAQLDAQNAALEVDNPDARMMADAGFRTVVAPLHADHVAGIRPTLLRMQVGALTLLLIGAVNLANLLLIRANGRTKEMAVRQALGAARWHVVSEAIVETTLLTLAGGLLGLVAGAGGMSLLTVMGAGHLPMGSHITFDARMACAALLGALALGLVVAAPIAWLNLRGHRTNAIQSETRGGTSGRAAQRLRHGFIAAQIAMALVLLAGAGLLGLSLQRAMAVSPGFRPEHVLAGQISPPWSRYPTWAARRAFNDRLLQTLAGQPGISAAGLVNNLPLSGNNGKSAATVKGHVRQPGESPRGHYSYGVDGDYFTAMGFTLKEGRYLVGDDVRRSARVCVVDDDFARYYWPNASAVGQMLFEGSDARSDAPGFTVVGVVGAAKQAGLTEQAAQGAVYYPFAMQERVFVVVRSSLSPESLSPALQRLVRQIDPELPVTDLRPMDARIADSLMAHRSLALLAGIFSAIALLLTAVGIYGVLSYAVTQRRREIGVRMALGAGPSQIRIQFLVMALRLLAVGMVFGVVGAWWTGRAMGTLLFQVPSLHLPLFGAAAGVIGVVSLVACLLPAHRAARIPPMEALADQG